MTHTGGLRNFVRNNKFPLMVAGIWLIAVWAFVLVAEIFYKQPISLAAWAGDWDAGWYTSIVEAGYHAGEINQQVNAAFFPLLPSLVWVVSKVTLLPTVWSGMLVSSAAFAAALVVLWHFVNKFFTRHIAKWTLLLVAFNPFSLYFGMFYTESLFLLLAVTAFWFIYEKQWWMAAFFAGLATATRSVGVAVAIVVICGWIAQRLRAQPTKPGWRTIDLAVQKSGAPKAVKQRRVQTPWFLWSLQTLVLAGIAFSGVFVFVLYMWWHTGDPFAFRTAQQFWPGRGGLTNIGNEVMYLWQRQDINMEYLLTTMWYASTSLAIVGLVLVLRMRQWLLALYTVFAIALPLAFGTATSMNRYVQVAFPIFIAYAAIAVKLPAWLRVALLVLCFVGLGLIVFLMVDPRDMFIG